MKLVIILTCFLLQSLFDDCEAEIFFSPKYKHSANSLEHPEKSSICKKLLALDATDINHILALSKDNCLSVNPSARCLLKLYKMADESKSAEKLENNALGHSSDISRKILGNCSDDENLEPPQFSYKPAMAKWKVETNIYQNSNCDNKAEPLSPQIVSPPSFFSGYDDVMRSNRTRFYICIYPTEKNLETLLKNCCCNICCNREESVGSACNTKSLRQPYIYPSRDFRHVSCLNWDLPCNSESESVCRYLLRRRRMSSVFTKGHSDFSQKIIKWILFCITEILVLGLIIYNVLFCD